MNDDNNLIVKQAANIISDGGVIAYPTSSIWGLGSSISNDLAITKLCKIKQRPADKGLIIIAGAWQQLANYFPHLSDEQIDKIITSSDSPCTWLVEDNSNKVNPNIKGSNTTVAIRIDQHPFVKQLCMQLGEPITSTSANPTGKAPAQNANEVREYFSESVDYIAAGDWQYSPSNKPSDIRDLASGEYIRRS